MARPAGEIFKAVLDAMKRIQRGTWRRVYEALVGMGVAVGEQAVRRTVVNMAKWGHLSQAGDEHVPWSRRPMRVYSMPVVAQATDVVPLSQILNIWGHQP